MRRFFATFALPWFAAMLVTSHDATSAGWGAAIEYYDAGRKHYFITAGQDEILALNSGRFFGWVPTGLSVPVLASDATNPGSTPVCRFYGNPDAGLDSHFYSADPGECAEVLQRFPGVWLLESWNVFRAYLPDVNSGACPLGTKAIYRLWNHRADVNHRYTDSTEIALVMENLGYVPEGYGPGLTPTAFCAPSNDNTTISCMVGASSSTPVVGSSDTLTVACSGNPAQYAWTGCTSSTNTCVATSAVAGSKTYSVTASKGATTGAPAAITVSWQAVQTPPSVSCSLVVSTTTPVVDTSIILTASCTGNPTSYSWVGCTSSTNTCVATSATAGSKTYSVTASNGNSTSAPTAISVNWQTSPPPPTTVSCALAASNSTPVVGSSDTLTATCTGSPTSYSWVGCVSSTSTCVATSATAGSKTYSVTASNGNSTSAPIAISVNWQTSPPPPTTVSCALAASNSTPVVGSSDTLTATCTGSPTSYSWVGCVSSTSTCVATSATAGSKTYSVTASNGNSTSAPTAISVNWQPVTPPTTVSCTLAASNTTPVVGSNITLTAVCTGNPTSYTWVGCTSTSSACVTTSAVAGIKAYSMSAANANSASAPATLSVNWLAVPPPGMPTSADFVNRATDPRGGDNAYNTFKRLPNGHGVTFGGFSHNQSGNNAVLDYDPVGDVAKIVVPNTPWVVSADVTGRSFLGNRDNHGTVVVDNKFWVMFGERGVSPKGNYRGILDLTTWKWTYIDDDNTWPAIVGGIIDNFENAAYGRIEALDLWYGFGGVRNGNPNDALMRIERNAPGAPYKVNEYWNQWGQSFAGSQKLNYVSQSHWDRGTKLHVYGGTHESWTEIDPNTGNALRVPGKTLYEIDVQAPSMTPISINSLADGQRVEGYAVFGYRDPARDLAVITDGKNVNVYNYATSTWFNVTVNTPPDPDRESPSSDGAGRQGFYSPEAGQLIILGGHGRIYGMRLNFGAPPPPATVSCTLAASNSTPVVGSSIMLTATCTGSPTSYSWVGCVSSTSTCVATSAIVGSKIYSVTASNGTSTSAPTAVSVNWQVAPPPPPPPPPGAIDISAGVFVALDPPDTGVGIPLQFGLKHAAPMHHPPSGSIYFNGGDYAGGHGFQQSYRQESWSFNIAARWANKTNRNAGWREEYPYIGFGGTTVQPKHPDYTGLAWDTTRSLIWMVPGTMVASEDLAPGETYTEGSDPNFIYREVMQFDPAQPIAQRWSKTGVGIGPDGEDTWMSIYDPVNDVMLRASYNGGIGGVLNILDCKTLQWRARVQWPNGDSTRIFKEYLAADFVGRKIYAIDGVSGHMWRFSMDPPDYKLEDLGAVPGGPIFGGRSNFAYTVWNSVKMTVQFFRFNWVGDPDTGSADPMTVFSYDPITATWTSISTVTDPPGLKVDGRVFVFDPLNNVTLIMGTLGAPYVFLYREP